MSNCVTSCLLLVYLDMKEVVIMFKIKLDFCRLVKV